MTPDRDKKKIILYPGDLHASREPAVVSTLLGSCVSACLFDPLLRIGGINHFLLPGRADMRSFNEGARYGINAMEMLINRLTDLGAARRRMLAKIFGGGHIITQVAREFAPGWRNAEFVIDFLAIEGIPVVSRRTGGDCPIKIHFHTDTGDVFLRRLPELNFRDLASAEKQYRSRLLQDIGKAGEVTLFVDLKQPSRPATPPRPLRR